MKLTKSKLKQIIREELEGTMDIAGNAANDALEQILPVIKGAYDSLVDTETQAQFEELLLKNIAMYAEEWQAERADHHEEEGELGHPLPRLTPQMHDKNIKTARNGPGTRAHPELGHEGGGVPPWLQEGKKK